MNAAKLRLEISKCEKKVIAYASSRKLQMYYLDEMARLEAELDRALGIVYSVQSRIMGEVVDSYIYSKTNVAEHLQVPVTAIALIADAKDKGVEVLLKNGDRHYVSRFEAVRAMGTIRRRSSHDIAIIELSGRLYSAYNAKKGTQYLLNAESDHVICGCPDYATMSANLQTTKIVCKHVAALFRHLGVGSLSMYVRKMADISRISEISEQEAMRDLGFA